MFLIFGVAIVEKLEKGTNYFMEGKEIFLKKCFMLYVSLES